MHMYMRFDVYVYAHRFNVREPGIIYMFWQINSMYVCVKVCVCSCFNRNKLYVYMCMLYVYMCMRTCFFTHMLK